MSYGIREGDPLSAEVRRCDAESVLRRGDAGPVSHRDARGDDAATRTRSTSRDEVARLRGLRTATNARSSRGRRWHQAPRDLV